MEAGGGLEPEKLASMRIMHVKDGKATQAVDLADKGINPAILCIVWHEGAFYITHRGDDLTGAVSRVTKNGQVETILQGIIDSQAEHQINDIRMGPDGRMYVALSLFFQKEGYCFAAICLQAPGSLAFIAFCAGKPEANCTAKMINLALKML